MSNILKLVILLLITSLKSIQGVEIYEDYSLECPLDSDFNCTLPLYCPDCNLVDCIPELKQEDCPEGTILEPGLVFGGCCPACVRYLSQGNIELT